MLDAMPVAVPSTQQDRTSGAVLLGRVLLDRSETLRPLYWREHRLPAQHLPGVVPMEGGLCLQPGALASFDTYFNALFEHQWRLYTRIGPIALRLDLHGEALLRVWRRTPDAGCTLLHEATVSGTAEVVLAQDAPNFRQAGLLWFEIMAGPGGATLRGAAWHALDVVPDPVGLGVVICTFNREAELARVLQAIAGDVGLGAVARVIVVNQGRSGLVRQPGIAPAAALLGDRLHVVEQGNFGGAGGFGRGLLETLDDPAVTHACLLDDDVRLEPESLARMATFFSLARRDLLLGGHMLDSVKPTLLYEAGAVVLPNWALQPLSPLLDLADPKSLEALLDVAPMHYNGWWMCGLPKRLLLQAGMPLPCFIRGDDVEFGLRLHNQGVPTVPLPGVGIWHEPFYLKIGGWQLYYETRNALICAALHEGLEPRRVVVLMVKRLLIHLLTYRYYNAALIVRAMQDFLQGPAVLDRDPQPLHASLGALRTAYPEAWTPREQVLPLASVGQSPLWRPGFVSALGWAVARNWLRSTGLGGPQLLDVVNLVWFRVQGADSLAVDTHWDRDLPTYQRDRAAFRTLLRAGLAAVRQLHRQAPALRRAWRAEAPRLTSIPFWRAYLGVPAVDAAPPARREQ